MNTLPSIVVGYPSNQGQLILDGTDVKLQPTNGSSVFVEDTPRDIGTPSLNSATALIEGGSMSPSTTYYVYASFDGTNVIIEPSTTGTSLQLATGYLYRTGTPEYAFLGTITLDGSGDIVSVFSYFNTPASYLLDRANHTGGQDTSTITSGVFDIARIPATAISKMVVVADQTARFALTTADVQNGDTVLQVSGTPNNQMFYVIDDTNLGNSSGYQIYTATADWTTILNKPQIIQDLVAISSPNTNDFLSYVGGAWVNRTVSQVKTALGINYTYQESSATSGTVTLNAQTTTLVLTGALAASLTIDCTALVQGPSLTIYSTNGVTALTISGGTNLGTAASLAASGILRISRHNTSLIIE